MIKQQARTLFDACLSKINRRMVKDDGGRYRLEKNLFFDEFSLYRQHFGRDDRLVIIDVGAYTGESMAEFLKAFPNAVIHGFEPADDNLSLLKTRFRQNDCVIINHAAVGAEAAEAELYVLGKNVTGNSLVKPSNQAVIQKTLRVPVIPLDQYCLKNNIDHIDILKIDTQGFEQECLNGARAMLGAGKIGLIKLEVMFHEAYARRTSFRLLEEILHEYGYYLLDICWIKKSSSQKRTLVVDVIYGQMPRNATT